MLTLAGSKGLSTVRRFLNKHLKIMPILNLN
jgi:hypothetical protein